MTTTTTFAYTTTKALTRRTRNRFATPATPAIKSLRPGDFVKIGIEDFVPGSAGGERIWVRLDDVDYPEFSGTVRNTPAFSKNHGTRRGEPLTFRSHNILEIDPMEEHEYRVRTLERRFRGTGPLWVNPTDLAGPIEVDEDVFYHLDLTTLFADQRISIIGSDARLPGVVVHRIGDDIFAEISTWYTPEDADSKLITKEAAALTAFAAAGLVRIGYKLEEPHFAEDGLDFVIRWALRFPLSALPAEIISRSLGSKNDVRREALRLLGRTQEEFGG